MKKILTSLATISLLSSMALAGDYYGGVNFGFGKGSVEWKANSSTDSDFSNTAYGLHIGNNLNKNSMIEVSFKSLTFDFKQNGLLDEDGTQFGVDYLYAFNNIDKLKPYLGGGITYSSKDIYMSFLKEDTITGLGLKLRAGTYYALTPKLDLGVELNYNSISWADIEFTDNSILESTSNFFGLGLNANYKF